MTMIVKSTFPKECTCVSLKEDETEEFKGILERVFGNTYQAQIFFENNLDVILRIED